MSDLPSPNSRTATDRLTPATLIGCSLLVAIFVLPLAWFFFWPAPDPGQILSVECEYFPGYSTSEYWWKINLDATGHGTYSLDGFGYKKQSGPISVPITELQQAIRENALATFPSKFETGHIPDAPDAEIHITTTTLDKTISLGWGAPGTTSLYSRRARGIFRVIDKWIEPHAHIRKLTPIKGRLLINGQPAKSRIRVTARDQDAPPEDTGRHAFTDANGKFQFTSVEIGDGLMSGTYDITILWGQTSKLRDAYLGPDRLNNRYDQDHPWKKGLIVEDDKPVDLGTIDLKVDLPPDLKDNDIDRFPEKTPPQ